MAETIGMVLDRIEAQQANALQLRPDAMSIDLLRAVYRNPYIPLPVRIRCAVAALPHEVPRLSVVAQVNEQDFATLLDQRLKRIEQMERIEATPTNGEKVDARLPPPIPDRRYRRI